MPMRGAGARMRVDARRCRMCVLPQILDAPITAAVAHDDAMPPLLYRSWPTPCHAADAVVDIFAGRSRHGDERIAIIFQR